jgi:hypothetical protein
MGVDYFHSTPWLLWAWFRNQVSAVTKWRGDLDSEGAKVPNKNNRWHFVLFAQSFWLQ